MFIWIIWMFIWIILFYSFYMYCILRKTFSLSEEHWNLAFFFLPVDLSCIKDQWKETRLYQQQSQGSQGYYLEHAGSKETRRNRASRVVFITNAWLSRHIVHLLLSIYVGRIDDRLNAREKICTSRDTTPGEISLQAEKQAHKAPFQI